MTNELILLGKGHSAGWLGEYWKHAKRPELWTLNDVVDARSAWHFDVHEDRRFARLYEEIARPGWVCSPFARVTELRPREARFPLREVYDTFGAAYFECTLDYMLALALLMQKRRQKRWDRIYLPGFDMRDGRHYTFRPGASYWLGVASGMGIALKIPRGSTLLKRVVDQVGGPHGDPHYPHAYGQSRASTEPLAEAYGWNL